MADSVDVARTWRRALAGLRQESCGPAFDLWIDDVTPLGCNGGVMRLAVPNPLVHELMSERYHDVLQQALVTELGGPVQLEFEVRAAGAAPAPAEAAEETWLDSLEAPPLPDGGITDGAFAPIELNPRLTFDTFVVGPSNRFPHAAAKAVAQGPARSYNPLFLYGGVGLGKTHLMQAIGHLVRELYPSANIAYVSGETFLYHFVTSIREDRTAEFRRRYRNVDVWLVDDIQFIASRESTRTEAEFFHTFNALHETNKQIVITSDRPPKELLIDDRLRSRFEWGLITDIKPPDTETRLAILQKRASEENLPVPHEVLVYIARVVRDSIRLLEGSLVKLVATASLLGKEVTLELAKECLQDYSIGEREGSISLEAIQKLTAEHFQIELDALASKSRRAEVVLARQVAMHLSREMVKSSFAEIGDHYCRDHSTVMHACTKIGELLDRQDERVVQAIDTISQRLERQEQV